jgi:hypothetical protein
MRARWKLGRLLAAIERHPGTSSQAVMSFGDFLAKIELDPMAALRAQRIGCLPEPELDKALAAEKMVQGASSFIIIPSCGLLVTVTLSDRAPSLAIMCGDARLSV